MNRKHILSILLWWTVAVSLPVAAGADAPKPSPSSGPGPSATHKPAERPAIDIFRVRVDNPGRGFGAARGGLPYQRVTGTVWFANDTNDTLTDVVLTVNYYNLHWYRSDGSQDYKVGTLGPKQTQSVDFRWDNWEGARVKPLVKIVYKVPGDPAPHTVEARDNSY